MTAECRHLLNIWNRKENVVLFLLYRPGQRPPRLFFKDLSSIVLFIFSAMSFLLSVQSCLPGMELEKGEGVVSETWFYINF